MSTLAVMAMMWGWRSGARSARMARVASMPSSTGICTSIRTTS
jgi:hypothetical protein